MSLALLKKDRENASAAKATGKPASLKIGDPNDRFEREADRTADRVMGEGAHKREWSLSKIGMGAGLQRKCACGGGSEDCEECKKHGAVQRKATGSAAGSVAPPIVHEVLGSPGQPLASSVRGFFEPRFGHDFGDVRVHTGGRAAQSAADTNALAYTHGRHIVFGQGAYAPESEKGRYLLAHELAHAVQQSGTANDLLQRQAAGPAAANKTTAEFEGCDPKMQIDLQTKQQPALAHVDRAIKTLSTGWTKMNPVEKAAFSKFFDPAETGDIDDGFVKDVRNNYQRIRSYMSSLSFDCNTASTTICGSGTKWCVGGRLMWTCFGALHVCPTAYAASNDQAFKIETMIHESVHNALHTTDREYSSSKDFNRLKPRGSGVLSFLSKIPVIGVLFRLFRSNNDTLYNPDSYSGFAMEL